MPAKRSEFRDAVTQISPYKANHSDAQTQIQVHTNDAQTQDHREMQAQETQVVLR